MRVSFLLQGFSASPDQRHRLNDLDPTFQAHFKSFRVQVGDRFSIFNGEGIRYTATLETEKIILVLTLDSLPKLTPSITLGLCVPMGSALEDSVGLAAECGVNEIYLLRSQFVQIPKAKQINFSRLEKIIHQSAQQAQLAWLPKLGHEILDLSTFLSQQTNSRLILCDETAGMAPMSATDRLEATKSFTVFIGPEGGWGPDDRRTLKGLALMGLGPTLLRVPTAVAAAVLRLRQTAVLA